MFWSLNYLDLWRNSTNRTLKIDAGYLPSLDSETICSPSKKCIVYDYLCNYACRVILPKASNAAQRNQSEPEKLEVISPKHAYIMTGMYWITQIKISLYIQQIPNSMTRSARDHLHLDIWATINNWNAVITYTSHTRRKGSWHIIHNISY